MYNFTDFGLVGIFLLNKMNGNNNFGIDIDFSCNVVVKSTLMTWMTL